MTKEKENIEEQEGVPVCEKCGTAMIEEPLDDDQGKDNWVCPHCDGEIDFFGDEDSPS